MSRNAMNDCIREYQDAEEWREIAAAERQAHCTHEWTEWTYRGDAIELCRRCGLTKGEHDGE